MLKTACRQAACWQHGQRPIGLWINVSSRQLEHEAVVHDVAAALAETALWPGALTLEIVETALMRDPVAATRTLRDLKGLGVRTAIDDFGTGYSCLAYLRELPVDVLKIDRSFISGITSSHNSDALTHTLVQLGKTLGLQTLGEGIEQWPQLRQLQHVRCDLGQGFLFARPLEAEIITELLNTKSLAVADQPGVTTTLAAQNGANTRSQPDQAEHEPRATLGADGTVTRIVRASSG